MVLVAKGIILELKCNNIYIFILNATLPWGSMSCPGTGSSPVNGLILTEHRTRLIE